MNLESGFVIDIIPW